MNEEEKPKEQNPEETGDLKITEPKKVAAGVPAMFFAFTALYVLLGVTVIVLLRRIAAAPRDDG